MHAELSPGFGSVGVVLLAAGASSRMGQPKQLLLYQGRTLLRRAAETALATGCQPIVLVTGAVHEPLTQEVQDLPVTTVHNPDWATGMGSSIRTGLTALEKAPQSLVAVLIMLCDQPLVTPALLRQLLEQQHRTQAPVVAAAYGDTLGVPAVFGLAALPALRQLRGAEGARKLIARYGEAVAQVSFPEGIFDVDTPAQYAALLAGSENTEQAAVE